MSFQLIYGGLALLVFVTESSGQMQNTCDNTTQPQCSTDCSTILLCSAGMENPIGRLKCPSNTPFCENGVCSELPSSSCERQIDTSTFLCTSAGVFPDPSNCVKYYYCSATGAASVPYECPFGNIFNSKTKVCQRGSPRGSSRRVCAKITCKESGYIPFTANPAFYARCSSVIGDRRIVMYKCRDEINQVFNEDTRSCEFYCQSSGYFANPLNCSTYYICDTDHRDHLPRQMSCPENLYFNGTACINNKAQCPPGSISDAIDAAQGDLTGLGNLNVLSGLDVGPLLPGPLVTSPLVTGPLVTSPLVTGPLVTSPLVTGPLVTSPLVGSVGPLVNVG